MNKELLKEVLQETWKDFIDFWKFALPLIILALLFIILPLVSALVALTTGYYLRAALIVAFVFVGWHVVWVFLRYQERL